MNINLTGKKSNRIIGLDWGSHNLKLMESIVDNHHVLIEKILSIPIPNDMDRSKPEILGKWLSDIWKKEKLKSKIVWLALPRHQALLTELELPPGDEYETRQMIELRIDRELPVPLDSVKSDYFPISQNELGNQKIAVVSCKKEIIDFYQSVFHHAKLSLEKFELNSVSLHRAIQLLDLKIESGIVVQIGHSNTEIIIIENKSLLYSRSASIGVGILQVSSPVDQSENHAINLELTTTNNPEVNDWINRWVFEIKRSLEGYTMDTGKSYPQQLVITGSGSQIGGLIDILRLKLGNSFQVIDLKNHSVLNTKIDKKNISQFITVYGLIHSNNITIPSCDLLNPKLFIRESHAFSSRIRQLSVGIGIGVLAVFILLGVLYKKERDLSRLQQEYVQYRPLVAKSEQFSVHASLIRSWKGNQSDILDLLQELSGLWTDDVYLQVFSYNRGKDINLSGLAKSNQSVAELLTRLTNSTHLKGAKFTYIRTSKRNPNYPIEFGLAIQYQKEGSIPKSMTLVEKP